MIKSQLSMFFFSWNGFYSFRQVFGLTDTERPEKRSLANEQEIISVKHQFNSELPY